MWRRHSHVYAFPFVCRQLSGTASALGLGIVLLSIISVVRGWWPVALVGGPLGWWWFYRLSQRLNPGNFPMRENDRRGHDELVAWITQPLWEHFEFTVPLYIQCRVDAPVDVQRDFLAQYEAMMHEALVPWQLDGWEPTVPLDLETADREGRAYIREVDGVLSVNDVDIPLRRRVG
jgi:hypothetical protein